MIGDRIRQVRELRGLTQAQLAERLAVTQSSIAYIESGRFDPSDGLLDAIALQTQFPRTFFKKEPVDFPLGSLLLFRARLKLSARDEAQTHRYAQTLNEVAESLAQRVSSITLRIPTLEETPERAAQITRTTLGLSPDTPIPSVVQSVERAGTRVLALPLELEDVDAFSAWVGRPTAKPTIALMGGKPGDRVRYSLAHELGHLVLHQAMSGAVQEIEREADRFAEEFLLPEVAMRTELTAPVTLTPLLRIKKRWGVSMSALIMRALHLHVINDRQRRYLYVQLNKHGWGKTEPTEIAVERPRAIHQMAELLYGKPIDIRRMGIDTQLSESFLRECLTVYSGAELNAEHRTPASVLKIRSGDF